MWNNRDKANHYIKKKWPQRNDFKMGYNNIIQNRLVEPDKILLPSLHIKLGIMKQYIKALDKEGECFKYLAVKFPKLSEAKIKEGIFNGPDIRKLMKDDSFIDKMNIKEENAWLSFKEVVKKFLGNNKDKNYRQIVANLVKNLKILGCNMSLKVHFLDSHIDSFPENVGDYSEEQGERFHQDIAEIEMMATVSHMMADYCWPMRRETDDIHRRRRV